MRTSRPFVASTPPRTKTLSGVTDCRDAQSRHEAIRFFNNGIELAEPDAVQDACKRRVRRPYYHHRMHSKYYFQPRFLAESQAAARPTTVSSVADLHWLERFAEKVQIAKDASRVKMGTKETGPEVQHARADTAHVPPRMRSRWIKEAHPHEALAAMPRRLKPLQSAPPAAKGARKLEGYSRG
jgi:hypothetical protein